MAVNSYTEPMISMVSLFGTTVPASGIAVNFTSTSTAGATGFSLTKSSEATNTNGLADVQLKLGNIPAEYSVTATCPNCEPSASSVTFTCCGKLPNDDFKQFDVRWADIPYDNICSTVPPGMGYRPVFSCDDNIFRTMPKYRFSIRSKGCALSALATLINYYKDAYNLPISSTTPHMLNTYLNDNNGYAMGKKDKGAVDFKKITEFSNSHIDYLGPVDVCYSTAKIKCKKEVTMNDLIQTINNNLKNNNPVIIHIPGHFMLVVGKCGNKYVVSDPGRSYTELYDPNGDKKLIGIRVFRVVK